LREASLASSYPSARPHEITQLPLDGFDLIFEYFSKKYIEKLSSKYDENNGHFAKSSMYIYDNVSLNSSYNEKFLGQHL
jgi:hypothetical protein